MNAGTLVLTAGDVAAVLDLPSCIDAVETAMRLSQASQATGPASLALPAPDGSFHVKAAGLAVGGRTFIAAKANINLPGNPVRHGLPTIQGVLALVDASTGVPVALMDSIVITSVRTAAVTAAAAKLLARDDAAAMTVVGCGEQGERHLRAMAVVRPIRTAYAIDVDADRARRFAARLTDDLGIDVRHAASLRDAIAMSDICVTCTTSSRAFIEPGHLHAGLFIGAVGADNPHKQEVDPRVLASSRVVVDSVASCAAGGDLHHAIDAGVMTAGDVHAELAAVVAGQAAGRRTPDEVFVFDSTGTALADVAAAILVYDRAVAAGRGLAIPLGSR